MPTTVEAARKDAPAAPPAPEPWYKRKPKLLLGAAVGVAAILAILWFVTVSDRRKEEFAARSLSQARAAAEAGNLPLASSELQRLITTYRGTDAASEAVITLNQVRMVNGQSELAAAGLREFLAGDPKDHFVAPASALLGAALENSREWVEAANAYQRAAEAADVDYLKASYLVDAARAFRAAGRLEEASRAYRLVLEKYPESPSFTEAQVRLAEITDGRM